MEICGWKGLQHPNYVSVEHSHSSTGPPNWWKHIKISIWNPIIDRMKSKLASWKGNLLSIGGWETLIKSCLSNLPLYYMSLFPILKGVLEILSTLQRQFLLGGNTGKKKSLPLVKWKTLEHPKFLGELGLGNLHNKNPF